MRKSTLLAAAAAFSLFTAATANAAYTISVETFRNTTNRDVPVDAIMEMMTTELTNSGLFQVVERSRLDVIGREQRLGEEGLLDPKTAPQTGRLAGAQYMMTGAVTKYTMTDALGGGVLGGGDSRTGGLINSNTAWVTLDARVVDTTTGAIVYAGRAEGAGTNVMGGLLNRYLGFGTGRFGGQMATASYKAVTKIVEDLRSAVGAGVVPGSSEGIHVLKVSPAVYIDAGSNSGNAAKGQLYAIYREADVLRDMHGNVLDMQKDYIAVIKITEVHPKYSKGVIIRGGGISRGDGAERIRKAGDVKLGS
jgi:curli biogenesis system outer membrane secretion channel CsgG